tara:strand:- start:81 stop:896 length:816 start_codon:yes stop_codon:yes gene_type:complete
MTSIPIFDSLTHPTLNGSWLSHHPEITTNDFEQLSQSMAKNNILGGIAVGFTEIGKFNLDAYAKKASEFKNIFPVAQLDLQKLKSSQDIIEKLKTIKSAGYIGIKIHPRLSQCLVDSDLVIQSVRECADRDLKPILCTYFKGSTLSDSKNNMNTLQRLLFEIKGAPIMLAHSCTTHLLEATELAKSYKNVLLDLSFTLVKYEGSSLDSDLAYSFNKMDQKICVGSDSPEISQLDLRRRFDFFSKNLDVSKSKNIAYKNILNFFNIHLEGFE